MTDKPKKINLSDVESRKVDIGLLNELRNLFAKSEEKKEKYDFSWNGKAKAFFEAASPTTKSLHPQPEESVDFDNSENLFITGDNLETLKLLQESYLGKIDMIYIDPPYNTGNDYVYHDDFRENKKDSDVSEGNVDENGNRLVKNDKSSGRYHSDWLTMMYPRLKLAKNLLSDDGVIFISIDDNEQANLKIMSDEIFGYDNFVGQFIWTKTSTPPSLSKKMRSTTEYVLTYEKEKNKHKYFGSFLDNGTVSLLNNDDSIKTITLPVGSTKFGFISDGKVDAGDYGRVKLKQDIIVKNGDNVTPIVMEARSRWTQKLIDKEVDKGTFFTLKTKTLSPRYQRVQDDNQFKTPNSALYKEIGVGTNEEAIKYLDSLGMNNLFDYPKPVSLVKYLINMVTFYNSNATVLDFFAGSGTTADAVMQLNKEDGGNRKFILGTLDEDLDDSLKKATKKKTKENIENDIKFLDEHKWPHTLDYIARERIRRSAKKIGDTTGFKALKIQKTGLREDVFKTADELEQGQLMMDIDNQLDNHSNLDLLYDVLIDGALDFNRELSMSYIDEEKIIKYDYFGELSGVICYFGNNLSDDLIRKIAHLKPIIAVFKESTFKKSSQKVNVMEQFRIISPNTQVKVI